MDFASIAAKIGPKKRQKYLVFFLIVIILAIAFVVWNYFLVGPKPTIFKPLPLPEIKINFEILESPLLEELEITYQEISLPEPVVQGRDNPFLPY